MDALKKGIYTLKENIVLLNGETLYAGEDILIHHIDQHILSSGKVYLEFAAMSAVSFRYGTVKSVFDTYEKMENWVSSMHFDEEKTHLWENSNEKRKRKYYHKAMLIALCTMITAVILGLLAGNALNNMVKAMTCSIVIGSAVVVGEYAWVYSIGKLNLDKFYYLEYNKMVTDLHKELYKKAERSESDAHGDKRRTE